MFASQSDRSRHSASQDPFQDRRAPGSSYAESYSRRLSQADYIKQRKRKKKKRIATVVSAILLSVILGGGLLAYAYMSSVSFNLQKGLDPELKDALVEPSYDGDPFYVLLMGVDGSAEREDSAEYEGDAFRSDSIMLVRVDPTDLKVTIVSLHRDTLVDMGEYGQNKLNAAHALGGAALAVEVVSELAGVPISHYAEINFDGFVDLINSIDGIDVDVPVEIDDAYAGGYVAAGPQTLTGEEALILCRSRHTYDDYGPGDEYRAANQRLVVSAIAKKVLASDLITIATTVSTMSNFITTDFTLDELVNLAQVMQNLDPDTDIYSAMEPTESAYIADIWYEIVDVQAWKAMMSRVDKGLPPVEETVVNELGITLSTSGDGATGSNGSSSLNGKRSGSIAVRNGSGVAGVAAEAVEKLESVGYTAEAGNADSDSYTTTIVVYNSEDQAAEAQEIVALLGKGTVFLNDGSYNVSKDFLVVIGSDW